MERPLLAEAVHKLEQSIYDEDILDSVVEDTYQMKIQNFCLKRELQEKRNSRRF